MKSISQGEVSTQRLGSIVEERKRRTNPLHCSTRRKILRICKREIKCQSSLVLQSFPVQGGKGDVQGYRYRWLRGRAPEGRHRRLARLTSS